MLYTPGRMRGTVFLAAFLIAAPAVAGDLPDSALTPGVVMPCFFY
jgi:hypothetical protein